jgi:Cu/Ag efflux protein CusF
MKKALVLVVLLTLVAFVSGVMAQQKPAEKPAPAPAKPAEKAKVEKFSGTVEKVDEAAKNVVVKGKVKKEEKTMTFAVDEKTKITKAGKEMPLADLKEGTNVSVEYKKDGDKMTATAIKAAAPKAAPKKEEPKAAPKK